MSKSVSIILLSSVSFHLAVAYESENLAYGFSWTPWFNIDVEIFIASAISQFKSTVVNHYLTSLSPTRPWFTLAYCLLKTSSWTRYTISFQFRKTMTHSTDCQTTASPTRLQFWRAWDVRTAYHLPMRSIIMQLQTASCDRDSCSKCTCTRYELMLTCRGGRMVGVSRCR